MEASWNNAIRLAKKASMLQAQQEVCGIRFDIVKARALVEHIEQQMQAIADEVLPQLPPRPLKKGEQTLFTFPSKPFKMDGTWSASMIRFAERHNIVLGSGNVIKWNGKDVSVKGGTLLDATMPMEMGNSQDLKAYFLENGWQPSFYNAKKDANGKPMRDPKTKAVLVSSPKMQDNGVLCPNLEAMSGGIVEKLVRWLSYRNRRSVLEGWLSDPRLEYDGRLSAASHGITSTFRQRHSIVANVPKNKPNVLLGKEMRELFVADEGQVLVGYDASSLEDRIKGHFTSKFDEGRYARKILAEGFDPHQENADLWGTDRTTAKGGTYALGYFCGAAKLATTLKCSREEAETRYDAYWRLNSALKDLDSALERQWEQNGKKYLIGIDGRKVYSRHRHSLVNLLIQSTGSILMDFAGAWMDKKLGGVKLVDNQFVYVYNGCQVRRVLFMHDEYMYSCDTQVAQEVAALGEESIKRAGEYFKLRVPLTSTASIGSSWAECH